MFLSIPNHDSTRRKKSVTKKSRKNRLSRVNPITQIKREREREIFYIEEQGTEEKMLLKFGNDKRYILTTNPSNP